MNDYNYAGHETSITVKILIQTALKTFMINVLSFIFYENLHFEKSLF